MRNNKYKVDLLAFGAHPDDVEFGCGGLMYKIASLGSKTAIVDLSEAELSTNGSVKLRYHESEKAKNILKAHYRENLQIPNNFFFNSKEIQKKLINSVRKYQPKIVLVPYYFDRHPDHENASKLIREALFTSGLIKYKTNYKPHRPKYVLFYMLWHEFTPSLIIDINKEFNFKTKSILAYNSQFNFKKGQRITIDNQDRTFKYIEARARNYGFIIGKDYGEPYLSINPIGINSPTDILPNFY